MAELNRNEMEAMRILWQGEPLKPAQIQERFAWPIENATLRSVLGQLVEKSLAARDKRGKAFFYKATGSRRGMFSRAARRMAQVFTGGSTADLIAQLIKNEKLSKAEIEELRRIAADKAAENKK
ncbi:MAG: BlaI/MecI/CopY family transcriptional regulator [Candidatus Sumerlaeia bacterium]